MTIKEMEERTGLTRANIRFYEAEGLITPQRRPNGYREYSDENAVVLLRVKLLRSLHLSLEEIKAIHAGDHSLSAALDRHLEQLERDKLDIQRAQEVCRVMRGEGADYQTLDAPRYLEELERLAKGPPPDLSSDAIPRVKAPWRRFFARMLDQSCYALVWMALLGLVFKENFMSRGLLGLGLDFVIVLVLNLLLEPLLLSRLGWTPGKWLMGLRVTDFEDQKLTFDEAMTRTKKVLYKGIGLDIPIFNLICMWSSHDECMRGKTLYWEENSLLVLRDTKKWRAAAYVLAILLLYGVQCLLYQLSLLPKHQGDLTVEEFAENYNAYVTFFDVDTNRALGPNAVWEEKCTPYGHVFIGFQDGDTVPHYEFTYEKDGENITGLSFQIQLEDRLLVDSYQWDMIASIYAFVRAQEDCGLFDRDLAEVVTFVEENPFTDYHFTACGVEILCDVEHSGYQDPGQGDNLWDYQDSGNDFSLSFSMTKTGT